MKDFKLICKYALLIITFYNEVIFFYENYSSNAFIYQKWEYF